MMKGGWGSNDTCCWAVVVFGVMIGLGQSGGARSVIMFVSILMMCRSLEA